MFKYVDAAMYLSIEHRFSERFLCEKVMNVLVRRRDYNINQIYVLRDYKGEVCQRSEEASI